MEVITERIQRIYDESGFRSVRAFALYAGINVGTFNDTLKKGNEPRFALLETILKCCPKVSAEWLMRGEGECIETDTKAPRRRYLMSLSLTSQTILLQTTAQLWQAEIS